MVTPSDLDSDLNGRWHLARRMGTPSDLGSDLSGSLV
jgi:hypothetical protein